MGQRNIMRDRERDGEGGFLNKEFFMKCPEEVFEPGQMVVLTHKEQ